MGFVPRKGSVTERVIAHLRRSGAPAHMTAAEVAQLTGKPVKHIPALLAAAIKAGALVKARNSAGSVVISLPASEEIGRDEAEPAAEGGGAPFECCLWDAGEMDLFGLEPIEVNGVAGYRASSAQVERIARLLLPVGLPK